MVINKNLLVSGILVEEKHEQGGGPPRNRQEIEAGFKQRAKKEKKADFSFYLSSFFLRAFPRQHITTFLTQPNIFLPCNIAHLITTLNIFNQISLSAIFALSLLEIPFRFSRLRWWNLCVEIWCGAGQVSDQAVQDAYFQSRHSRFISHTRDLLRAHPGVESEAPVFSTLPSLDPLVGYRAVLCPRVFPILHIRLLMPSHSFL